MKKLYNLKDEVVNIILDIKNQLGFKTEVDTLTHIILSYYEREKIKKEIDEAIREIFRKDFVRFRLGIKTAERNSIVIKDILNSMLYQEPEIEYFPSYEMDKHYVIKKAEERLEKMIKENNVKKHDLKGEVYAGSTLED